MRELIVAIALALCAAVASAHADTFPSRPITLIVPYPPGGSTDVTARILADKMGLLLGQPVVVENVGGAGGSLGVGRVARATPDGYTIDIGQWDTHVGSIIYNLNYDLQKDFAPIGLATVNPQLLIARKAFPADDLKALVDWMKAHPGDAKFVNQNASGQVGAILLQKLTATQVLLVPYRGAGPALTDLISGQVDLAVFQAAVSMPQVKAGTLKALANLSPAALAGDSGHPDVRRRRRARLLYVRLVRHVRAEGYAGRRHQNARHRDGAGAGRSGGALAPQRSRPRRRTARATDAGRPCRVPESRDREVVADHQGGRDQGGVKNLPLPACGERAG